MRVFAAFHRSRALLPNIDRAIDHAIVERQAADNETTSLAQVLSDHILDLADIIIKSYHQRALLVDRHHVGMAVHRLVRAGRLQNEAVVPLVRLEIGSESLLSRRRSVRIGAEAIMPIFDALVAHEHRGALSLRLHELGADVLLELDMKAPCRPNLGSLGSLDAVRREGASVGREGAVVKGMEILGGRDDGALLREDVDQLVHIGNDLLSILHRRS